MQFVELSGYPLRPGTLIQWVPKADKDLDQWLPDARGTSHVHEDHLRGAVAARAIAHVAGGRESWLGVAIEFDGPLSIPNLRAALTTWIDRHEVLRSHVLLRDAAPVRRTQPVGAIEVLSQTIGSYANVAALRDQIQGEFDRKTAPLTWPAYLFATVARDDDFTLLFAADHSLVDGYSLVLAPYEFIELYEAQLTGRPEQLPPVGSYVDFSASERERGDAATAAHPAVAVWSEFLSESGGQTPPFPMPLLPVSVRELADETRAAIQMDSATGGARVPQGNISAHLLDDDAANQFTLVCSEAGGSLFAGILACMATINMEVGAGPVFRCVIPRHTRDDAQWLAALGWFVSVTPFRLDTSSAYSFRELVVEAMRSWRASKAGTTLPYLRIGELLGDTAPLRFVVSFMDTRSSPRAAHSDAGGAAVLRSRDYSTEDVYLWINRTPSGLHVSARFPGFSTARRTVTVYLGALRSMLTEIGDKSGYHG